MKNKLNLTTLILTMIFSFTVTSVVWAECTVTIAPEITVVLPGGSIIWTAETEGEGCNEPNYTWEIVASDCTAPSSIDENGEYTASEACNCDCVTDVIKVTDTANGNIFAEATAVMTGCCNEFVTITPDGAKLCNLDCQTFTAVDIGENYTWELDGRVIGTGDSIEVCGFDVGDGIHILTLTEPTFHFPSDSVTITVGGTECCSVDVGKDQIWRSRWIPFPAVITIQIDGFDVSQNSQVTFECDSPLSVIKLIKLVDSDTGIINQFAIIMPTFLTGNFQDETETCTVSVGGCEQTAGFELNFPSLGSSILNE